MLENGLRSITELNIPANLPAFEFATHEVWSKFLQMLRAGDVYTNAADVEKLKCTVKEVFGTEREDIAKLAQLALDENSKIALQVNRRFVQNLRDVNPQTVVYVAQLIGALSQVSGRRKAVLQVNDEKLVQKMQVWTYGKVQDGFERMRNFLEQKYGVQIDFAQSAQSQLTEAGHVNFTASEVSEFACVYRGIGKADYLWDTDFFVEEVIGKNLPILDIREKAEIERTGALKGTKYYADFFKPGFLFKLMQVAKGVMKDGHDTIAIVCANARRTALVANFLSDAGIQVYELKGGLNEFKNNLGADASKYFVDVE